MVGINDSLKYKDTHNIQQGCHDTGKTYCDMFRYFFTILRYIAIHYYTYMFSIIQLIAQCSILNLT